MEGAVASWCQPLLCHIYISNKFIYPMPARKQVIAGPQFQIQFEFVFSGLFWPFSRDLTQEVVAAANVVGPKSNGQEAPVPRPLPVVSRQSRLSRDGFGPLGPVKPAKI